MGLIRWTPVQMTATGVAPSPQTPTTTDTYQIRNDGNVFLHVLKTGAGSCNVVVTTPGTVGPEGLAIADLTVSVPASTGNKFIGPFSTGIYNDQNGDLAVTFSEVTGLTAEIWRR